MRSSLPLVLAAALSLPLTGLAQKARPARTETALDRYVRKADPTFRYQLVKTVPGQGYTAYVLDMVSQTWRTKAEVDRPEWQHWVTVIKPDQVKHTTGFLLIAGGANNGKVPDRLDPLLVEMALTTQSVVTELRMVPNQPLTFADDGKPRVEDAMIAYTWDKYLKTSDETWPARLPMTKSAVRAMDAVTAFCAGKDAGEVKVEKFVVAGASKRGWTTWATAAVDPRVAAIMPLVIDTLNNEKSFEHHYRAYGFYSPAIKDYEDMGMPKWRGTPKYAELMTIEDPYFYRSRFTMPKLIINAAGDQYFLPDSSRFYFDDLPGEKYLRYVPNTDHSMRNSDVPQTIIAYYDAFLRGQSRPRFSWKLKGDVLEVTAQDKPSAVNLWLANNPEKRDFRLASIGPAYKSSSVNEEKPGVYVVRVPKPEKGWTAYFVELTFPTGGKYPLKVTTPVQVTPDTLPFDLPK